MNASRRLLAALVLASALLVPAAAQAAPTGVNGSHVDDDGDPYVAQPGNIGAGDTAQTWSDLEQVYWCQRIAEPDFEVEHLVHMVEALRAQTPCEMPIRKLIRTFALEFAARVRGLLDDGHPLASAELIVELQNQLADARADADRLRSDARRLGSGTDDVDE